MLLLFFSDGGVSKDILAHVTHMIESILQIFLMLFRSFSAGVVPKEILTHITDMAENKMLLMPFSPRGAGGWRELAQAGLGTWHRCIIRRFASC